LLRYVEPLRSLPDRLDTFLSEADQADIRRHGGLLLRRAGPQTGSPSLPLTATAIQSPGRPQQHRLGDREAKRLRGLEVDHELKLGGLLDGQVAEECLFPEVESLATRMKGLALCGEDLFSSFFGYVLQ
jgi:hypothetical protein